MKTQKNKSLNSKIISSSMSVIISLSLVLFVIGVLCLVLINSQKISDNLKENIGFKIMLENDSKEIVLDNFKKDLRANNFVKSLTFITKEEAAQNLKDELGEDFEDFLGYNPLLSSIDLKLKAPYANNDSLQKIAAQLTQSPAVFETYYQKDLVNKLNSNLNKLSIFLLIFSSLLFFIAFALINNTIRLSVYAKRFLIRTMRLVGANDMFIQKPFLIKGMYQGFYSAIFAMLMIIGALQLIHKDAASMLQIDDLKIIGLVFVFIFLSGILLSILSTFFAVKKYIKLNENELYN